MKKYLIALFLFITFAGHADINQEISHLLNYVATTDCQYERNGDFHSGKYAVKHIKKKHKYFADDIATTEDFIKYAATKSKMSGKYYLIHCPSIAPLKSQDWLLAELQRYRHQ